MRLPKGWEVRAELAKRSFYMFAREFWETVEVYRFVDSWHIALAAEVLQEVQQRKITKLALCKPPGTTKSRLLSVLWPAWVWLQDPTERVLLASYNLALVAQPGTGFSSLTRKVIESEKFRLWYPGKVVLTGGAEGMYETTAGGFRFSTTCPRGPVTGRHGTIRIVDDPIKPDDVSKQMLEDVNLWYADTWASRDPRNLDAPTVDIVSMQRLAYTDLVQEVVDRHGFTLVNMAMEYQKAYAYARDPRTVEGELLDPVRFPQSWVDAKKDGITGVGPMVWAAQYQQTPVPDGGAIFHKEWFQSWSGVISDLPKGGAWVHTWDCTFKDETDSDYVVGQVWYVLGAHCYLVDQVRGQWDFPETCKQVLKLKAAYRADKILIEDKANGPAVLSTFKKTIPGLIPINPEGGKIARANAVTGMLEALQVFFPTDKPWFLPMLQEFLRFPKGKHDDQVDAATQCLNYVKDNYTDLAKLAEGLRNPDTIRALLGL